MFLIEPSWQEAIVLHFPQYTLYPEGPVTLSDPTPGNNQPLYDL